MNQQHIDIVRECIGEGMSMKETALAAGFSYDRVKYLMRENDITSQNCGWRESRSRARKACAAHLADLQREHVLVDMAAKPFQISFFHKPVVSDRAPSIALAERPAGTVFKIRNPYNTGRIGVDLIAISLAPVACLARAA